MCMALIKTHGHACPDNLSSQIFEDQIGEGPLYVWCIYICNSMYNIPHLLALFSQYIPNIVEAALERLTRESKTPELRTMCLQVVSTTTTFKILHPCTITYFTLSPTSAHCLLLFLWPPFSFSLFLLLSSSSFPSSPSPLSSILRRW